jgi:ubiquinone/menaquinone biosynthesis C-methylase UbiE
MPTAESIDELADVSNEESIACRERAAGEFAACFAEGREFWHAHVINPCVLDLACGEGHLARELVARAGGDVEVHGVDASQTMIRIAREKSAAVAGRLTFHVADAAALTSLPAARFDVAVCNMALMDIKDYRGAIAEVARTLKQGGIFVFSLLHPCFFTPQT